MQTHVRIKERRRQLDMSQDELGFLIGTNQTQVSRYERGENSATGDVLVRIADALNTTTDFLLGRTDYADRPLRGAGDLAEDEFELVSLYRAKNAETRQKALMLLKVL